MTTIHADELRPGDVVDYHGQRHCVTQIDRHGGWSFRVAFDDPSWAIALGETDLVVVDRLRGADLGETKSGVVEGEPGIVQTRPHVCPRRRPVSPLS
jgi:hypothetical protein